MTVIQYFEAGHGYLIRIDDAPESTLALADVLFEWSRDPDMPQFTGGHEILVAREKFRKEFAG